MRRTALLCMLALLLPAAAPVWALPHAGGAALLERGFEVLIGSTLVTLGVLKIWDAMFALYLRHRRRRLGSRWEWERVVEVEPGRLLLPSESLDGVRLRAVLTPAGYEVEGGDANGVPSDAARDLLQQLYRDFAILYPAAARWFVPLWGVVVLWAGVAAFLWAIA